jgi:hypothetical protein
MNFTENGTTRSNLKIRALHKLFCDKSLVDKSRSGRPQDISAESRAWLVSLACMKPKDLGYPHEI